jgi:DNA-binding protein
MQIRRKTISFVNFSTVGVTVMYLFSENEGYRAYKKIKLGVRRYRMSESNAVLIGNKPVMNYVLACITLFHGGAKEVSVKARGRSISRAVDVVEVVRRRFLPDVKVKKIGIGTQQMAPREEGSSPSNVSTIEIWLER